MQVISLLIIFHLDMLVILSVIISLMSLFVIKTINSRMCISDALLLARK